jgi:hypothetical protein
VGCLKGPCVLADCRRARRVTAAPGTRWRTGPCRGSACLGWPPRVSDPGRLGRLGRVFPTPATLCACACARCARVWNMRPKRPKVPPKLHVLGDDLGTPVPSVPKCAVRRLATPGSLSGGCPPVDRVFPRARTGRMTRMPSTKCRPAGVALDSAMTPAGRPGPGASRVCGDVRALDRVLPHEKTDAMSRRYRRTPGEVRIRRREK